MASWRRWRGWQTRHTGRLAVRFECSDEVAREFLRAVRMYAAARSKRRQRGDDEATPATP